MQDLKNKNVYIIGGSSGIGLAAAIQFARGGADVRIFSRDENRLELAAKEISGCAASEGRSVAYMQLDVSDGDQVNAVMAQAVSDFGAPDVLLNCAGRAYPYRFEDVTYEQFDETIKINLYGIWNIVSAALPFMKKKGGYIVNVSSVAGIIGVFGLSDYCASKFGIIGLSEALRSELKQYNIRVSVLCPPDTDTPAFEVENRTKPPETKAISETAALMQPAEVATALLRGMQKSKFLIVPGANAKFSVLMKRLFPSVVNYVMERTIHKVQKSTP